VDKDYIIKNSDIVAHDIHRHEPPVASLPVKVVRVVDGVIIVDKPSSIPVHPSGRYRHNTVLHILSTEQGYKDLYRKFVATWFDLTA
jgi:tRNA pseudouridine synthase 9